MDIQTYPTTSIPPPPKGNPYTGRLVPAALSVLLLVSFFCPWLYTENYLLTGFNASQVVRDGKALWLLPLLTLYTLYTIYAKKGFAPVAFVTGLYPFLFLAYAYFTGSGGFITYVAFGWWAAIFIGFMLAAAAARSTALAVAMVNRTKKVEVLDHFYIPLDQFNMSSREFYEAVQKELLDRKVPGLSVAFIHYNEASILSAKRTYLRLTRGQLVFDVCAAPFGKYFFFSCRFCSLPVSMHPMEIFLALLGLYVGFTAFITKFGLLIGSLAFVASVVLIFGAMRRLIDWLNDKFELELPETPIFGALYARFHKENYYEYDTKLMYQTVVPAIVKNLAAKFSAQKGFERMEEYRRVPGLTDLYEPHLHNIKPCPVPLKTS